MSFAIITLLIAFCSLIVLMIIHEFGHFIIAKKFGVKVEEFGIGYPPRMFGKQFGETVYSINWVPLGAFVKIYGEEGGVDDYRSFANLPIFKRILICLGGVLAFWLAAMVIFTVVFMIGASVPVGDQDIPGVHTSVAVVDVQANSPASAAGLQQGDVIVRLQGKTGQISVNTIADFQMFVQNAKGSLVAVTVNRQGKEVTVQLTPRASYPTSQGPVGVALERFADVIGRTQWYLAPFKGIAYTGTVTVQALEGMYGVVASLFQGRGVPQGAQLAGPVGITIFLSQAAMYGPGFFLYFIGSLTVLLAIFNLFPIPALDGGKLLFLLIEKILGHPVSVKWEQGLTIFFFFLLISISIFVTIRFDIPRVIDFWKAGL